MAFSIGETVGDYQVVGILGAGGMGKVYKVRNVISDRVEAMKVLLPDLAQEGDLADRFIREIKLLASLNHPNIAQLHTALKINNQLLMIMEFVEGRSIEGRLRDGRMAPREAVDAISQALAALSMAHERGIVHRDIKPANIMLTSEGTVKLMDFGIAKAAADRRLTMTGTTLGSLFYMSPEQVKGAADLDGRSDLYSVGVTLYEMVTGTRPFQGDSDYSIMVAHLEQQPVPPIQIDPTLPPALNEIILTAIHKNPGERFQTAQAFRAALENVKAMLPATAAPWTPAAQPPVPQPVPHTPVPQVPTQAQPSPYGGSTPSAPAYMPPAPQPPPPAYAQQAPPYQQPQAPQQAYAQQPYAEQPYAQQPYAQAPAGYPPPPPPAGQGRRAVWMTVGGLAVVVLLVLAITELPKHFGANAGSGEKTAQAEPTPAPPVEAPTQPPQVAEQAPTQPPAEASAVQPAALQPTTPAAGQAGTVHEATSQLQKAIQTQVDKELARRKVKDVGGIDLGAIAGAGAGAILSPKEPASPSAVAPPQPAVDREALNQMRSRARALGSRSNAASRSLKQLEAAQQAQGLGLRGDISAAWDRVQDHLEEANLAIKDGDLAAADKSLDLAERDLDKIEKFLGR